MTDSTTEILKEHKLRITNSRKEILGQFLTKDSALSLGLLEERLPAFDRVTIYRTLNSFMESGIIHKIPNDQGKATFGLCHSTCGPEEHMHDHIHFKCNTCGKIECFEDRNVPKINVPSGYQINQVNLIVDGVCLACCSG